MVLGFILYLHKTTTFRIDQQSAFLDMVYYGRCQALSELCQGTSLCDFSIIVNDCTKFILIEQLCHLFIRVCFICTTMARL